MTDKHRMNPEVKKLWVEALRSGEYKQVTGALKREGGYCCLGVLSDLYIKHHPNSAWDESHELKTDYVINMGAAFLPREVAQWAGLSSMNPTVKISAKEYALASLNDGYEQLGEGCPRENFSEIADLIEEQK